MAAWPCECCRRWLQGRGLIRTPPIPQLLGAEAEHKTSPGRLRVTTDCWATYCHLYLQKLVDFPPQLNRLTASALGFEFLVWTNQWTTRKTTKTTTKEMVSACYLQIHIVLKEKISNKKDTSNKTREEVPPTVHRSVQNHKTLREWFAAYCILTFSYSEWKERSVESHL